MCGITAIFNKAEISSGCLVKSNAIVSHRGPDDEGYVLWKPGDPIHILSGNDTASSTRHAFHLTDIPRDDTKWKVGLGHRRLSILDLSPSGHQPMTLPSHGLVITFNGEIFNYIEIRTDLEKLGHHFHTGSDTEVILHAWAEWGAESLHHFNGMFAFVLLNTREQKLYAVRDRFGVKPMYFTETGGYIAFTSEVKQLRVLPGYSFKLNSQIAYDYLRYGLVDHDEETFENNIHQLKPGMLMEVDVHSGNWKKNQWYSLKPKTWKGSEREAFETFYHLLKDSVRLRMRSDVPVGSALSGGLDSSTIVCLMREVLENENKGEHLIKTITSCNDDKKYDEWEYAEVIINRVNARSFKVFPSFEKLKSDLDRMLWHLDYPFGSTSQFSQWCVFEEAKKQGLTVMIDGQGADEQLGGYGGNDMSLYAGLVKTGKVLDGFREVMNYKSRQGRWPTGFLLGAAQINLPWLLPFFPKRFQPINEIRKPQIWIKGDGFKEKTFVAKSLRQNLLQQVQVSPLPSLLRYEDRNSMAFSVESRVPFMDYRLMEFTVGLPENLIYKNGERKYILRKAFRGVVPDKILERKDKMGFVSAEEKWVREEGKDWFNFQMSKDHEKIDRFIDKINSMNMMEQMQNGAVPFSFEPWRILSLQRWLISKK